MFVVGDLLRLRTTKPQYEDRVRIIERNHRGQWVIGSAPRRGQESGLAWTGNAPIRDFELEILYDLKQRTEARRSCSRETSSASAPQQAT